jgi:hypothetical protein
MTVMGLSDQRVTIVPRLTLMTSRFLPDGVMNLRPGFSNGGNAGCPMAHRHFGPRFLFRSPERKGVRNGVPRFDTFPGAVPGSKIL